MPLIGIPLTVSLLLGESVGLFIILSLLHGGE